MTAPVRTRSMLARPLDQAFRFSGEMPLHDDAIRQLYEEVFGPGRFSRAAERVREMAGCDRRFAFVAECAGTLAGSVRVSPVLVGPRTVLMLGPLAVRPGFKGRGAGRALMGLAAAAATQAGEQAIVLVGDEPYYGPLGYRRLPPGRVRMPGPVDERRVLGLALVPGALEGLAGAVAARR